MRCFARRAKAYFYLVSHFFKIFIQLVCGVWKLAKIKAAPVTIFGGTHLSPDSIYMKKASDLSRMLSEHDIPVLTGGGPGVMEAATCGAENKKNVITTMAIWLKGLTDEKLNICAKNRIVLNYFFARKYLLVNYSVGFAVFPGGFGTLNELTELLTLIQNKLRTKAPIVLIGKDYWEPIMNWILNDALRLGLILDENARLFTVSESVEEAFEILYNAAKDKEFSFTIGVPKK